MADNSNSFSRKILPLVELKKKLEEKDEDKSVVLCHGVFDLMHIGHIKYLEDAKKYGDILVVTITPDQHVNKGPNRPVFSQNLRAEALAALQSVDFVAINEWPTAIETINLLAPNFYVKGPDYKNLSEDISGNILLEKNAVESQGGSMVFTDTPTESSSSLLNEYFEGRNKLQKDFINQVKSRMDIKSLDSFFEDFEDLNVLVLGEAIIDEYIFCETKGKSGKDPFLVSQKLNSEKYSGGALAVAKTISSLTRNVDVFTYIGENKEHLDFIKSNLSQNMNLNYVLKKDCPTIHKVRYVDAYTNSKTYGVYELDDRKLSPEEEQEIINIMTPKLEEYDLVILVDYGHGLISKNVVDFLRKEANFLCINSQSNSFNQGYYLLNKFKSVNYITIHEGELRQFLRDRESDISLLIEELSQILEIENIMVTQGKEGLILLHDGFLTKSPAFADKIIDRVGSGDTILGISSLCLFKKHPPEFTALFASLMAANTIASSGTGHDLNKINAIKHMQTTLK